MRSIIIWVVVMFVVLFVVLFATPRIRNLKMAAIQEDRNAYEIVEEAVEHWLKARKSKRNK
jgi:hypothetical protein